MSTFSFSEEAVARLLVDLDEARSRANEAARLSAAARDRADDLEKAIADLREQISILDGDRTDVMVWVVNTSIEFGLGDDPAIWLPQIAAHMREQRKAIERISFEHNEARTDVVRLGKQVEAARQALDGLNRYLAADRPVTPTEVAPLFDALFPKWSET